MKCPPYAVSVRVADDERRRVRLWLPLFLLWPLLPLLLLLMLIVSLLVDVASAASGRRSGYTRLMLGCLRVAGEIKGTEVFVQARSHNNRTVGLRVR